MVVEIMSLVKVKSLKHVIELAPRREMSLGLHCKSFFSELGTIMVKTVSQLIPAPLPVALPLIKTDQVGQPRFPLVDF